MHALHVIARVVSMRDVKWTDRNLHSARFWDTWVRNTPGHGKTALVKLLTGSKFNSLLEAITTIDKAELNKAIKVEHDKMVKYKILNVVNQEDLTIYI